MEAGRRSSVQVLGEDGAEEVDEETGYGGYWSVNSQTARGQFTSALHMRKPRKKRRVMGCELRRQLKSPARGCDCSIAGAPLEARTRLFN